jgi:hypothetical protein
LSYLRVLAFDLNKNTGWCADPLGASAMGIPWIGHFQVDKGGDPRGACFLELERQAALLIEKLKPDLVAYEAPLTIAAFADMMEKGEERRRLGQKAQIAVTTAKVRKTYGYAAIMDILCTKYGLEAIEVNVQDARSFFVQNRYAKKEAIEVRCRAMKYPITTADEADACCAWEYTRSRLRVRTLKQFVAEAESRAAE